MTVRDLRTTANIVYNRMLLEYAFSVIARMSEHPQETVTLMQNVMQRSVEKRLTENATNPEIIAALAPMVDINSDFFRAVADRVRHSSR